MVDIYALTLRKFLSPKRMLRRFTSRMPPDRLYSYVEAGAPTLLTISDLTRKVPIIGRALDTLIPVADGLIYIRPVYVVADVAEFRFVIVSHDNGAVLDTNLESALSRLFPGFDAEIGDRVTEAGSDVPPEPGQAERDDEADDTAPDSSGATDPARLADEAARLYLEAQELLMDGDLAGYEEKLDQMGDILLQLAEQLNNDG